MKIDYALTDDQREVIVPLINRALTIVPPEFTRMRVIYEPNLEDLATVTVRTEYRLLSIRVGDEFFGYSPDDRERALVHEFVHIFTDPLRTTFEDVLNAITSDDSAHRTFAWDRWNQFEERAVVDIAETFNNLIKERDDARSALA
jgi:hypothetical protein